MWLTSSSIGRKLVMAITGACLVLFVTFHCLMNAIAIVYPAAYNVICQFLGANWYALLASMGLAALFIIHIIYAVWLTLQNRKARGNDRYNIIEKPKTVEWSSQNMLVLGIVIVAFLAVHMIQFWSKMQLVEVLGEESLLPPAMGTLFIQEAFSRIWTPIVYIIGFVALWLHMNHGFWSMFQSAGWNGQVWLSRVKKIALWWTSIVVALFVAQTVTFTIQADKHYYLTNPELRMQYLEAICEELEIPAENFSDYAIFSAQVHSHIEQLKGLVGNPDQMMQMGTDASIVNAQLEKFGPVVELLDHIEKYDEKQANTFQLINE